MKFCCTFLLADFLLSYFNATKTDSDGDNYFIKIMMAFIFILQKKSLKEINFDERNKRKS